ncbi:Serine/threonine-protein kinase PrkC [Polystyrenella longa]|uniref:Serine/threonine-protein kinase PrkC n=1 Tax=Polystyrenella longa TaxID=2528007 RepID=A0A518CLN3_9PLAN|nr:serine/threonine-protein kinase [Polystyrenella longa]QDU80129.1 Serine/threonine-protein kinase PrkC [Polystyrenella longa]
MFSKEHPEEELSAADRYLDLWESGSESPVLKDFLNESTKLDLQELTDVLLIDQSERWAEGKGIPVEQYFENYPELSQHPEQSIDLIYGEFRNRTDANVAERSADLESRFPEWREKLQRQFEVARWMEEIDLSEIQRDVSTVSSNSTIPLSDPLTAAPLPFSDYQLDVELGEGAMGKVYRATQKSLGKTVAIKILGEIGRNNDELRERFLCEARMVASLHHPHIVDVHGLGRTNDNRYFLVMDYIDGKDLDKLTIHGRLSVEEIVPIMATIARAIDHAHSRGIIHRDIKPGNILVDSYGQVKVTDFGLSLQVDESPLEKSDDRQIIGTPQYMAPEQADRSLGSIDSRTDVYGLGGLLFTLLTGEPPVVGSSKMQVLAKLISPIPNRSPREVNLDIPVSVELICMKALKKDPQERFQSAREFEEALLKVKSGSYPREQAESSIRSVILNIRPNWAIPTVLFAICLTVLIAVMMLRTKESSELNPSIYTTSSDLAGKVNWQIMLYPGGKKHLETDLINLPQTINEGDSIRLNFQFEEAIYPYVVWIGTNPESKVQEINVLQSPQPDTNPVKELKLPGENELAFPLIKSAGTELCLLIFRNEPLPESASLTVHLKKIPQFSQQLQGPVVVDGQQIGHHIELPKEQEELLNRDLIAESRPLGNPELLITQPNILEMKEWIKSLPEDLGEVHYLLFQVNQDLN